MRGAALLLMVAALACDGSTVDGDALVVEAFFDVGQPLPDVLVRRTVGIGGAYPTGEATGVADAEVVVTIAGAALPYAPVPGQPGRYRAATADTVRAGAAYRVDVRWQGDRAWAETQTPPRLRLDSLRAFPFARAVRAVLLDSLRFDTLATGAREGFVYPVEVVAWWPSQTSPADTALWVRSQLRPGLQLPGIELVFPPERIAEEGAIEQGASGRVWRGLYAVPVASAEAALPLHRVRVAFVRGGRAYARYAATRGTPGRREPLGNVQGGIGIVAGVSVDSLTLQVGPAAFSPLRPPP